MSKQQDKIKLPKRFPKQLSLFLVNYIACGIAELIDSAFGNHINIDSVVVLSAFTILTWVFNTVSHVGGYAYQNSRKDAKLNLYINAIASIIIGILLFNFNYYIIHLFSLTESQYILFNKTIKVYALTLPFVSIGKFIDDYLMLNCKNKESITGNTVFYILMILIDAIVIKIEGSLPLLIFGTGICYLVYDIMIIIWTKLYKEKQQYEIDSILKSLKTSTAMIFDKLTGKVATIIFNIFVSKLGTELYAIHSICYALEVFTEYGTSAFHMYCMVTLPKQNKQIRLEYLHKIMKQYTPYIIIINYIACGLLLLVTHGVVDLRTCALYAILYCSQSIFIIPYESYRAYLLTEHKVNYLAFGGVCGILVRTPIAIGAWYFGLGLIPFSLACSIDFFIRGMYFKTCINIIKNNEKESNRRVN